MNKILAISFALLFSALAYVIFSGLPQQKKNLSAINIVQESSPQGLDSAARPLISIGELGEFEQELGLTPDGANGP